MSAKLYTLEIEQNATRRFKLLWKDKDGVPVNLTGARVEFQVRESRDSEDPVIDFDTSALTTGQSLATPLNTTGVIEWVLSKDFTAALDYTAGVWDMFVTIAGGERRKLLKGPSQLEHSVTR